MKDELESRGNVVKVSWGMIERQRGDVEVARDVR